MLWLPGIQLWRKSCWKAADIVMRHVPGNLSKIAAQITLQAPNAEMLEDRLTEIFDLVTVLDENGEDMMFHLDLHAIAVGA